MQLAGVVLEYLKVLAWPLTVLLILWRYRKHIEILIKRVVEESSELEGFGLKAKLRTATVEERRVEVEKETEEVVQFRGDSHQQSFAPTMSPSTAKLALLAQELVLRDLETRWGLSIRRAPVLELPNGRRLQFDGLADKPEQTVFVEVKLISDPRVGEIFMNATENVIAVVPFAKKPVLLHVVLVTRGPADKFDETLKFVRQHVLSAPVPTTLEHFRLEELLADESESSR